ncbi:MAG: flagellar protein FlgN, partial [Gammaproteobacteria bacterium]
QLQKLLEKEQFFLRKNEPSTLQRLLEEKAHALVVTQETEKKLERFLHQFQCPFSPEGVTQLIQTAPPSHRTLLNSQWLQLLNGLATCKRLNQINGKVLSRIQVGLTHVLSTLKGQDPTQQIYHASGITQTRSTARLIAQA